MSAYGTLRPCRYPGDWFELAPHAVGTWRVGTLPGNYCGEEWQTIASLLGIQTAAVGGFMYFLTSERVRAMDHVETGVQTLCYGLGII